MTYDEAKKLGASKERDAGNGLVLKVEQIENYFVRGDRTSTIKKFKQFVWGFDELNNDTLEAKKLQLLKMDGGFRTFPFIQLIERIQAIRNREPHNVLIKEIDKILSHQSEPVSVSHVLNHLHWYYDWRKLGRHGEFQCTLKELGYQLIHLTTKGGKLSSTTYIEPPVVLYNRMLDRVDDWAGAHMDDGDSAECCLNSAHAKVKEEFGDKNYEGFTDWLDEDNPGPHG